MFAASIALPSESGSNLAVQMLCYVVVNSFKSAAPNDVLRHRKYLVAVRVRGEGYALHAN
jgi:hypothetical protein